MIKQTELDIGDILRDAGMIYSRKAEETAILCPVNELLPEYLHKVLTDKDYERVSGHIHECEQCRIELLKLEADQIEWEQRLRIDPDKALAEALGPKGIRIASTHCQIHSSPSPSPISKIKEALIKWISPMWEPMWAGEPVTAADIPEQSESFESDEGRLDISCSWEGQYHNDPAYIRLKWKAYLSHESRMWVRFIDPKTQEILYEVCLGKDTEGQEDFTGDDLGFDPSNRKWAISFILLDAEP
jgi:hypothetical protein